jgi:formylglycine-generating enzyme required for sulfatase activity
MAILRVMNSLRKLLRGGSWDSLPRICRLAYRARLQSDYAYSLVGFRVVCLPAAENDALS